jgi:BirA family biotin operon repressor/biotin-[acetyl-CoA-carboxylase] ligase
MSHTGTEPLDVDEIKSNLRTKCIGRNVLVFNHTSSTNDIARRYIKDKNNDGLAIFAEEQTAGRGRGSNKWYSSRSDSIICSILLIDNKLNIELLSLTTAVAVADAVGKPAKIKWPNDIILNDKKVGGILLETIPDKNSNSCIIGIGINCHQKNTDFPIEIQSFATSLDIESHSITYRNLFAKRLLSSLDHWLEISKKNSRKIVEQWHLLSILLGHRVILLFNGKKFAGNCIGIDPEKGLILQLDTGGVRMFDAAHTTIIR